MPLDGRLDLSAAGCASRRCNKPPGCLDQRQNLQERISTALEVASSGPDAGWRALLVSDAARFASKLDPRKIFPYRLPRVGLWSLMALALAAGLGFVPEYRSKDYLAKQQDAQAVKEAGRKIVEITQHTLDHHPPALEPTRQALESAGASGFAPGQGRFDPQ